MTDSAASDLAHAEMLADRALTAFPRTALVHYAKAQVLRAQQRFEEAILQYEQVLALNRNWVRAIAALGYCKFITGSIEEAIPAQERAVRLSPPRSADLVIRLLDWAGASAAIARGRVDPLVREGSHRQSGAPPSPRLPRLRLRPQRGERARQRRTRPCPQAERR